MINLSVILPTINEGENLKNLIPNIYIQLSNLKLDNFEVIVVDDGSTDNTSKIISDLSMTHPNLKFIQRTDEPSLPKSIQQGILSSEYEYVLWLDADGSMSAKDSARLIKKQIEYPNSVIIGSRFVSGGGYKGSISKDNSLIKSFYNLYNSEDSLMAVFLSKIFNELLSRLGSFKVKDITSGFIIGKKVNFPQYIFDEASYGEYFISLVNELENKNIDIVELGYVCLTRIHGVSKTGTNYIKLFKRGIPYIKVVNNIRKSARK